MEGEQVEGSSPESLSMQAGWGGAGRDVESWIRVTSRC
jgi:hypothetical protein